MTRPRVLSASMTGACLLLLSSFAMSLLLLCLGVIPAETGQADKPTPITKVARSGKPKPDWTIRQNGNFDDRNVFFFARGSRIHLYSEISRIQNDKIDIWEPDDKIMKARWKGEPYYHEFYDLVEDQWVKKGREFSRGTDQYLDFGPCDPLNQLDLQTSGEIKKALPASINIKAIAGPDKYTVIVYSDKPEQTYFYPLTVALLVPDKTGWRNVGTAGTETSGYFCGTRFISTKLTNSEELGVLLLYSSDSMHRTVRSYAVRRM